MKVAHYWEVSDNYSIDGRSNDYKVIGCFVNKFLADEYSKGRGNYGHKASVREVYIEIYDSIAEAKENDSATIKARALAKLTPREKKELGLSF